MKKRHFTATVYIVKDNKVLLVHHRKLGIWLAVGGHIDENETPDIALKREAKEEAGIDIEVIAERDIGIKEDGKVDVLLTPRHILLEDIKNDHDHIDLIYFARPKQDDIKLKCDEHHEIRWFSEDELDSLNIPHNAKYLAKKAIKELGK